MYERDSQTYVVIGIAMEVHRTLGPGFPEPVYQDAMEVEFLARGIPHAREVALFIDYKGVRLRSTYRVDFVCYDRVLVELKALFALTSREEAQVIGYLKACGMRVALLINFGAPHLQNRRFAL